jgi:hypothetical protein
MEREHGGAFFVLVSLIVAQRWRCIAVKGEWQNGGWMRTRIRTRKGHHWSAVLLVPYLLANWSRLPPA